MFSSSISNYSMRFTMKLFLILLMLMTMAVGCLGQSTLWAWGDDTYNQLGNNSTNSSPAPVQVLSPDGNSILTDIAAISSWGDFSLALRSDGTVWAWGYNNDGELGINTLMDSPIPAQVVGVNGSGFLTGVSAIAAGDYHSLALMSNGSVCAWGYNENGELGNNSTTDSPAPVQVVGLNGTGVLTNITAIATGGAIFGGFCLALKSDGTVWTWGANAYGQLGVGSADYDAHPTPALAAGLNLKGIVALAAGATHCLALKSDGTVWAWGGNAYGQLGNSSTVDSSTPTQVVRPNGSGSLTGIIAIAAGAYFSLALKSDGTVWAWGNNDSGQLGNNSTTDSAAPVQVVGLNNNGFLTGIGALSAGWDFALALGQDSTVWAWGDNASGQLGHYPGSDGDAGTMPMFFNRTPTQVYVSYVPLNRIAAIAAGYNHSVALTGYEMLWQNAQTGDVYEWLMNQTKMVTSGLIVRDVPTQWKIVGTGNFSDGATPDILWQNLSTREVGIWTMNNDLYTGYIQLLPPSWVASSWQIVGAGNFNGDGSAILWQNTATGEVGYLERNYNTFFQYAQIEPPGIIPTAWHIVGVGNISGAGGAPNILWQNTTTGEIGYWTLTNGQPPSYTQIEPAGVVPTAWRIMATPDINGDGEADIVFQNQVTGEIGCWRMSNGKKQNYFQIEPPSVVAPAIWQLRTAF